MTLATRAFAAEIEAAVDRPDVGALQREYWAQDEFLFQEQFLPPSAIGFTMEYVTSQEMGRVPRLYSTLKDAFAYFGIRALLRGRPRRPRSAV